MDKDIKKTGYVLLIAGLVLIIGALVQILLVYTNNVSPIEIFKLNSSDFAIDGQALFPQLPANLTKDLRVELIPAQLINTSLNLGFNTLLCFVFIFAGSKIAGIGVNLLRPVFLNK